MELQFFELRWNSPEEGEIQANNGNKFAKRAIKKGDKISLRVCSGISCAGSIRENAWKPCPNKVEGKKKCDTCRNREGSFVFTTFDGFNTANYTPEDLAKLKGPHVVYLALFGEGMIKVGVSKKERKQLRQVEQGSDATLYIAESPDGIIARQIETILGKSGLVDKLKNSQKKDFGRNYLSEKDAEECLRAKFEKHRSALTPYAALCTCIHDDPEFVFWDSVYGTDVLKEDPREVLFVKLEDGDTCSGIIKGMKGNFVIIEEKEDLISISGKDLIGKKVDFTDLPIGIKLTKAIQTTLL